MEHRGFYRRRLPHFDAEGITQFVSFSLVGTHLAMSSDRLDRLNEPIVSRAADAPTWLARDDCATIVESCLHYGEPKRYELLAWVIMPDHVHLVLRQQPGVALPYVINGLKSYSALQCNRALGRTGQFWTHEYWDRTIRNEEHLRDVESYIRWNPVKAGLVESPESYRWGHAWEGDREFISGGVQRRGPGGEISADRGGG